MRHHVWLKCLSPCVISARHATGNQLATLEHIPGSVWRGAVAQELIVRRKLGAEAHQDPVFKSLFLEDKLQFGDLRLRDSTPFPLSTFRCADYEDHGVRDLLLDSALEMKTPKVCGKWTGGADRCEAKLVPATGFYRWDGDRPVHMRVGSRVNAHTAICNETLRVRNGQFHSSTALDPGQTFEGELWADDAITTEVEALLHPALSAVIGRGGSRGQGSVEIRIGRQDAARASNSVASRLQKLNELFIGHDLAVFTVSLRSPCIVYDEWLRARPYLLAHDIAEAAGVAPETLAGYELLDWFSRRVTISGWNAQAGLPKTDATAIAPGSAFLFGRTLPASQREEEISTLATILGRDRRGIGDRWQEGLGEASFCDEIHFRMRPPCPKPLTA